MHIIHDRDNCIGCGACSDTCPKYWELSLEDGRADLKNAEKKGGHFQRKLNMEDLEENKAAADFCPTGVIKIV